MKRQSALVGSLAAAGDRGTSARAQTPVDLPARAGRRRLALHRRGRGRAPAPRLHRGRSPTIASSTPSCRARTSSIAICYTEWAGTHYPGRRDRLDRDRQPRRRAPLHREARRGAAQVAKLDRRRRCALAHAGQRFENSPFVAKRRVIDMSGDGRTNDGPPAEIVRDKLVSQGIVVNGLPVMMNRHQLRPPARPHPRQVLRGERHRRPGLVHDRGRQFRPFRPRRAHQAGARDLRQRRPTPRSVPA